MPTRRRSLLSAAAAVLALAAGAWAGSGVAPAIESATGLVLAQGERRARVETPSGDTVGVPLRRNERMSALVETRDGWLAAGTRERRRRVELTLLRHGVDGTRRLRPPALQEGRFRIRPVPMLENGRLAGLAWLEGDSPRGAAVRAAVWTGVEWEPVVTVSPPGPGSQTGLAGAVLADGSWMLVWSRYDGSDDEIYFSRLRGATWDRPRRLAPDNRGPDITPSLMATRAGALLAWSRLEGSDYRVQLARFEGGRWLPLGAAAGPGTLYPRFARREERGFLVYREARANGWTVLETDERARVLRRAAIAGAPEGRPALALTGDAGVSLRFPTVAFQARWEVAP